MMFRLLPDLKKEIAYLKLLLENMENIEIIEEHPLTFHKRYHILLDST